MAITDETKKQGLDVLRKHAAELGISQQFEEAASMSPQQIADLYNSEIVKGQYGIDIPTPTVNSQEDLQAFHDKFADLPMPGSVPDAQFNQAVSEKKGFLSSGGLDQLKSKLGGGFKKKS